jgi:hypothetical protein
MPGCRGACSMCYEMCLQHVSSSAVQRPFSWRKVPNERSLLCYPWQAQLADHDAAAATTGASVTILKDGCVNRQTSTAGASQTGSADASSGAIDPCQTGHHALVNVQHGVCGPLHSLASAAWRGIGAFASHKSLPCCERTLERL